MAGFSWSQWLGLNAHQTPSRESRKPRQTKTPQVEGLEERTLLTASPVVAIDDIYSINEDTTLNGTSVLANDTLDGTPSAEVDLAVEHSTPTHGSLTFNSDGTFTYTPNPDFNGFDSFTYRAKDSTTGELSDIPATVTIQITSVLDSPVADTASFSTAKNVTLNAQLTGSDGDDDFLTFYAGETIAEHGVVVIDEMAGTFTYTPNAGYSGTDTFSFKTYDGSATSAEALVTITVLSAPPQADAQSITTDEDTPKSGVLTGSDPDGDDLTFIQGSVVAAHGTVVINLDGTFTYTPEADFFGTDSFSFKANDGDSESVEATVSVTVNAVNDAPVGAPANFTTTKNVDATGSLAASDAEGDSYTFAQGSVAPLHGTVDIQLDGSFVYTPDTGYSGTDSFSFKATDGSGFGEDVTITITVENQIPVADPLSFSTNQGTAYPGQLTGSDDDGDSITYLQGSVTAEHGVVVINLDGTFTYTPDADYDGTDSFSFITNDGTDDSLEATVSITVLNQAPVADPQSISPVEDTPFDGTLTGSDADLGDVLTYLPGLIEAEHGDVVINPDGTFTYTPDADFNGPDSFSFKIFDGTDYSSEATVTVNVTAVNDAPRGTSASLSTNKNSTLNGSLAAVDPEGDSFTFTAGTTATAHGSVTINSDGTFEYTPDTGYTGEDSFTFTADDGSGAGPSGTITIAIGNRTPVADPATVTMDEDTTHDGVLSGTDLDGDTLTYAAGAVTPQYGSVTVNPDGSYTYTPDANYFGTDSFSFTVSDGTATSTEATVSITIENVNDAPVATGATETTPTNVDLNGTLNVSDLDDDTLTYTVITEPQHGELTINSDGTYKYTPDAGFRGIDSFTYKANDGTVDSVGALVSITVANAGPTVSNGSGVTDEDSILLDSVSPLGLDPNGDQLTYTVVTPPQHGRLVLSPDGVFVYVPDSNYHGTDSFQFQATDGIETSATATFSITVTSVDDAFNLSLSTNTKSILKNNVNVSIDNYATVADIDTQVNYASSTVTISVLSGGNKHDTLSVKNEGTGIGLVKVKGSKIYYNASTTPVATFTGGKSGKPLQITFSASATEAAVNAVLKQIGFKTVKGAASGTRVIQYLVNAGGNTSQKTVNINVV